MSARRVESARLRPVWAVGTTLLLVLSSSVWFGVAVAADPEALVKEGVGLRREGKDLAALKKFEEANALQSSPRTLAQIGLAEQAIGRWGAADRHLRAALSASDDAWITKNRKSLEQALRTVGQHTGQLEISGTPAGSDVMVDGEQVGKLPLSGPIGATAGVVAIEVRSPGYVPVVRSTQVVAGGLTRESFNLQSTTSAVTPPPTTRRDPGPSRASSNPATDGGGAAAVVVSGQPTQAASSPPPREPASDDQGPSGGMSPLRIGAVVAAGLSVGALAFGIFEHLKWQDRVTTFGGTDGCSTMAGVPMHGSTACQTLYDDGQGARTLAFVGYGVAAASAATALVLYLVSPDASPPSQKVACGMAAGSWGLACGGRF